MLVLSLRERGTNSVVLFSATYALCGTLDAIYECESCVKLDLFIHNEIACFFLNSRAGNLESLLEASWCFLEVPWDVFQMSSGALEASLERLGAAMGVS